MDGSPRADQPDHTQAHAQRAQEGTWEDTGTDGEWTEHEWLEWRMAAAEHGLNEHGEDIRGLWEAVNALDNQPPQPMEEVTAAVAAMDIRSNNTEARVTAMEGTVVELMDDASKTRQNFIKQVCLPSLQILVLDEQIPWYFLALPASNQAFF